MNSFSQQQLTASTSAIDNFRRGTALWGILLAQMQSGKTETYLRIACELLELKLVDFVVIFSGNSEIDLCEQVYENVKEEQRYVKNAAKKPSSFWPKWENSMKIKYAHLDEDDIEDKIGRKFKYQKKISVVWGTELNQYSGPTERTLFIWEEAHFAQNITQRPDKFLKKIGISANGNIDSLRKNQNLVLSVSATPFSELADIHHFNQEKFVIKMEPGTSYVSVKQIRDSNRLKGWSNLKDGLQNAFALYDPSFGPQYVVIRVSKKTEEDVREICAQRGWKVVIHDSVSKERDEGKKTWDSMDKAPERNTAILIRGMCRMGKNMQKKHLLFVFETAKKSATDTILQGLLGRSCGYSEGSDRVYVFIANKIIESKELDRYIELWDNDGVTILPNNANNLIANKETKYKHPIIPFAIENAFNPTDSNKTVMRNVRNLLKNTQFVPPKTEEAQFQEIKARLLAQKTDYEKNEIVVHNVCDNVKANDRRRENQELYQWKWRKFCEKIMHYNSTPNMCPEHLWHTGIKTIKGNYTFEEGRIINIFRYDNDMPEYGIKAGTVYIYGVTNVRNSVFSEKTNIPRTTQKEVFAHHLEDRTEIFSNGAFTIDLSVETATSESQMYDGLNTIITVSAQFPNSERKIHSCWDDETQTYKGILVNDLIYESLTRGRIFNEIKTRFGVTLKTEKAEQQNIANFIRLTSISW